MIKTVNEDVQGVGYFENMNIYIFFIYFLISTGNDAILLYFGLIYLFVVFSLWCRKTKNVNNLEKGNRFVYSGSVASVR